MEIGAVKHQLNNEIIQLKKKLNQAKVQLIHKLTRKARTLKIKETLPEHLKCKLKRKADAAVAEVLIIKKVQAKDLARFAITHTGNLQDYINKPTVNSEKVYAKILQFKGMSEKYNSLRSIFANMPIDSLLMTRKERLKLKKEQKEKEMNKEGKMKNKSVCISPADSGSSLGDGESNDDNSEEETDKVMFNSDNEIFCSDASINTGSDEGGKGDRYHQKLEKIQQRRKKVDSKTKSVFQDRTVMMSKTKSEIKSQVLDKADDRQGHEIQIIPESKAKQKTKKTKHKSKSKVLSVKEQAPIHAKVIDSFFLTPTGDHYLTLSEPRAPDEVKEEHFRGNRKMRRAEKFGKPMRPYMKKQHIDTLGSKYAKPSFHPRKSNSDRKFNEASSSHSSKFENSRNNSSMRVESKKPEDELEKLHPSWAAKKQKSGIAEFQGKKVVFS